MSCSVQPGKGTTGASLRVAKRRGRASCPRPLQHGTGLGGRRRGGGRRRRRESAVSALRERPMGAWQLATALLLLLLFVACASAADIESDSQALRAFLSGLSAAVRVQWPPNSSVCSWQGVICSATSPTRVRSLRLPAVGLYGTIPASSLGLLSELRILSLRSNGLTGSLPEDLANCTQLRSLYLHDNAFSGPLPSFATLVHLVRVNLASNNFSSFIPPSLSTLRRLGTLYLQNNSFSGPLPSALASLPNLVQFSVAYNALNGSLPSSLQMRFGLTAFAGNSFCGAPLFPECPSVPSSPTNLPSPSVSAPSEAHKSRFLGLSTLYLILLIVGVALLLLVAGALCLVLIFRRVGRDPRQTSSKEYEAGAAGETKGGAPAAIEEMGKDDFSSTQEAERNKLVFFEGSNYTFDLEDLLRASAEVLGKGSVGTAYKAVLEDGSTVVVKRLKDVSVSRKDFEQHIEQLGRLQHRNLVPLRAYYYSKDEKLLLYDYLPLGSLSALLHGSKGSGRTPLDWDTRVKIASGAAKGLSFLHEQGGGSKFVHGNIKSSNVLLGRDFNASMSDFGLAPLFGSSPAACRITGYRAPEVVETRKVTHKSDVYSYGVLLLELLTGKAPTQTSSEEGIDLPRWVQSVVREEWTAEVFDVELMRYQNLEEEMVQMLQIAMACVATIPDQRPSIAQVVKMIEDVRAFETDDGTRQSSSDKSKESNGHTPHRTPPESLTPARITP